jgi:hypothetical protein
VASVIRLDDTDWSEHVMRDGHGTIPLRAGSGSEYRSAWPSRCSFPMLPAGLTLQWKLIHCKTHHDNESLSIVSRCKSFSSTSTD